MVRRGPAGTPGRTAGRQDCEDGDEDALGAPCPGGAAPPESRAGPGMPAANTGGPAPLANGHASHVHPAGSPAGSGGAASGSGSGRLAPGLGAGVKGRSPRLAAKALAGVRSEAANGYIKAGGAPAAHAGPPHTAAAAEGERARRSASGSSAGAPPPSPAAAASSDAAAQGGRSHAAREAAPGAWANDASAPVARPAAAANGGGGVPAANGAARGAGGGATPIPFGSFESSASDSSDDALRLVAEAAAGHAAGVVFVGADARPAPSPARTPGLAQRGGHAPQPRGLAPPDAGAPPQLTDRLEAVPSGRWADPAVSPAGRFEAAGHARASASSAGWDDAAPARGTPARPPGTGQGSAKLSADALRSLGSSPRPGRQSSAGEPAQAGALPQRGAPLEPAHARSAGGTRPLSAHPAPPQPPPAAGGEDARAAGRPLSGGGAARAGAPPPLLELAALPAPPWAAAREAGGRPEAAPPRAPEQPRGWQAQAGIARAPPPPLLPPLARPGSAELQRAWRSGSAAAPGAECDPARPAAGAPDAPALRRDSSAQSEAADAAAVRPGRALGLRPELGPMQADWWLLRGEPRGGAPLAAAQLRAPVEAGPPVPDAPAAERAPQAGILPRALRAAPYELPPAAEGFPLSREGQAPPQEAAGGALAPDAHAWLRSGLPHAQRAPAPSARTPAGGAAPRQPLQHAPPAQRTESARAAAGAAAVLPLAGAGNSGSGAPPMLLVPAHDPGEPAWAEAHAACAAGALQRPTGRAAADDAAYPGSARSAALQADPAPQARYTQAAAQAAASRAAAAAALAAPRAAPRGAALERAGSGQGLERAGSGSRLPARPHLDARLERQPSLDAARPSPAQPAAAPADSAAGQPWAPPAARGSAREAALAEAARRVSKAASARLRYKPPHAPLPPAGDAPRAGGAKTAPAAAEAAREGGGDGSGGGSAQLDRPAAQPRVAAPGAGSWAAGGAPATDLERFMAAATPLLPAGDAQQLTLVRTLHTALQCTPLSQYMVEVGYPALPHDIKTSRRLTASLGSGCRCC